MNEKHIAMAVESGFRVKAGCPIGFCGYIVEEELEAYTNLVIADAVKDRDKMNIQKAVNKFLGWKLPKDFYPDNGISFDKKYEHDSIHYPIGTNLFTADQAKAMFEYCLADSEHGYDLENTLLRGKIASLEARIKQLEEALIRLRDCDWVISLPDRMDAVRDIAKQALGE